MVALFRIVEPETKDAATGYVWCCIESITVIMWRLLGAPPSRLCDICRIEIDGVEVRSIGLKTLERHWSFHVRECR